jgi:hypothetical protein
MKCKNHPTRDAVHFCESCGVPLCEECSEEPTPGHFFCFQCAMLQAVSGAGTTLKDKREKAAEKKVTKKREWGPFQYFVILSSVLIAVMWGVIIFGRPEEAPGQKIDFARQERVFLFMVNSSIKRYHFYEGKKYPETLTDLVPKYLPINEESLPELNRLSYTKKRDVGYSLSLANPKPGEMNIIITPQGIKYETVQNEGV